MRINAIIILFLLITVSLPTCKAIELKWKYKTGDAVSSCNISGQYVVAGAQGIYISI